MKRSITAYRLAALTLALGIFLVDTLTPLEGAVAVLYVVVVLLAAATGRSRDIVVAGVAGIVLTLAAYALSHGLAHAGGPTMRATVSVAAITIATLLALRNQRAQEAMHLAQAELAHALRVSTLGELSASIAHEVNQPLMAVVTSGEAGMRWLRRETPDLHEVESALARITAEAHRAGDIVSRIRDFLTKSQAPRTAIEVDSVIREATELVRRELAREQVELRVDVAPGLPPVIGDRIQLQQVFVNLMLNAGQAMAGQESPRRLSIVAARSGDDRIEIAVSDTGPGIAGSHIARLFDPFFTTRPNGMGMGLAICRTTVDSHGGQLAVHSIPGEGATFRITLPVS